jgi:hypothetical protein
MQNSSDVLNECLEAMWHRGVTIASCIQRYPEFTELGTLLRFAAALHELPKIALTTASKEKLRQQMLSRFDARPVNKPALRSNRQLIRWLRPAIAVAFTLIVIFSSGVSLIQAASSAIPGDTLYGVKRAVEDVQLSLADSQSRVGTLEAMANTRLNEITVLVSRRSVLPDPVLNDVSASVNQALNAEPNAEKKDDLLKKAADVMDQAEKAGSINTATEAKVMAAIKSNPSFPTQETPGPIATPTLTPTSTITPTPVDPSDTPTPSEDGDGKHSKPTKHSPIKPTRRPTKIPNQDNGNNGNNGNGNKSGHGN